MFNVLPSFLFLFPLAALPAPAQLPEALTRGGEDGVPAPDGPTLSGILRTVCPEANASWTGTLSIRSRGTPPASLPVTSSVEVRDAGWSVSYSTPGDATHPAERVVVIHSTNAPNKYLRAIGSKPGAEAGETRPIAIAETDTLFAGSDFLISDLGLEFLHWPKQVRVKGELHSDRSCHVLESKRTDPPAGGYARVMSWVDKETGGVIEADAFNQEGKKVKNFSLGGFQKVNGVWQLKDMQISNLVTGSRSKIEFNLGDEK